MAALILPAIGRVVLHKVMLTGDWLLCNTLNINVVSTSKLGQSITCLSLPSKRLYLAGVGQRIEPLVRRLRTLVVRHLHRGRARGSVARMVRALHAQCIDSSVP